MSVVNWIKKPYFFINSPKFNLLLCFGVGFFIFLFLYLFQPFGIRYIDNNKLLYTAGFGLVTFIIQLCFFLLFPYLFQSFFDDEKWTVGKNILFLFLLILSITFGNWYYNSFVQNTSSVELLSLKDFFLYTFSISILPITIFTYVSEKLYRIHREKTSKKIMESKISLKVTELDKEITIFGDNKKDCITFNIDNLVYINSEGNYASFHLKTEKEITEKVIRNTLTKIDLKLKEYNTIKRCHKSYIINTKFMDSISGNARGYYLKSKLISNQIPISRSFKKEDIKNLIQ